MIKLADVKYLYQHVLEITFSDGCIKQFDFAELFDFTGMEAALKDTSNFEQVRIADDQRSMFWNNGYDCCADWLRYFAKDINDEWAGVVESVDLRQRIKLAQQHTLHTV